MAHRIKNTSTHAQGLSTLDRGTVYIPAGGERTLELADVDRARRFDFLELTEIDAHVPAPSPEIAEAFAKFDGDGDGLPGGSKSKPKAAPAKRRAKRRRKAKSTKAKP